MDKRIIKTSKFMSLVLRHQPEVIGLELDECGWANIAELISQSGKYNKSLNLALIQQVVATNDKQRFSISEDGCFVRANQGHSIDVDLNLQPQCPPTTLYHGTATRFKQCIYEQGLVKRARQHVHLSATLETAISVGQRHGKPVVLLVAAEQMHQDGYSFYLSKNGVWLTQSVPVHYLSERE
ncbi:RNA:NAD 2'-phosphotransferase [hydrothermal vent metagenome]|uniref:RNA:NAD 2'-phosphotransferase n=1 Tax=hydrothermal vent metagenome TaxID=652676 RepID=A0A3B0XHT3_9ZZZZ